MSLFILLTTHIEQEPSLAGYGNLLKIVSLLFAAAASGSLTKKMLRKYQRKLAWSALKLKAASFFKKKKKAMSDKKLIALLLIILVFILLAITLGILAAFIITAMALLIWLILDKYILVD
jgi:hypothetical protein